MKGNGAESIATSWAMNPDIPETSPDAAVRLKDANSLRGASR